MSPRSWELVEEESVGVGESVVVVGGGSARMDWGLKGDGRGSEGSGGQGS